MLKEEGKKGKGRNRRKGRLKKNTNGKINTERMLTRKGKEHRREKGFYGKKNI